MFFKMKSSLHVKKIAVAVSLVLSSLLLVLSWSFSSAPGGSPDEPAHFISIYCFNAKYQDSCSPGVEGTYNLAPVKAISACYLYQRDRGAGCEVSNIFEKLDSQASSGFKPFTENNYYKILSLFATDYYVVSLLLIRVLNGLLFFGVVFISYLLFPKHLKQYFILATLAVNVPLGIYIVTSINSTSWLLVGITGFWASLYSLLYEIKYYRLNPAKTIFRFFLLLFSIFLATSSRFDGIYFVLITLASMFIIFLSQFIIKLLSTRFTKEFINYSLFILFFSISSLIFFVLRDRANVASNGFEFNFPDRIFQNISRLPHLLLGPFGTWGLGWLDVWLSPITYVLMILTVFAIAFHSLRKINAPYFISITLLAASSVLLPLLVLQSSGYLVGEWVQPRYVLPLYIPLLGILLLSAAHQNLGFSKVQIILISFFLITAHSFALFANLERYIRGQNTVSSNLEVDLNWWWADFVSPNLVWIAGSLAFTSLVIVAAANFLRRNTKVGPEGLEPPTPAL